MDVETCSYCLFVLSGQAKHLVLLSFACKREKNVEFGLSMLQSCCGL